MECRREEVGNICFSDGIGRGNVFPYHWLGNRAWNNKVKPPASCNDLQLMQLYEQSEEHGRGNKARDDVSGDTGGEQNGKQARRDRHFFSSDGIGRGNVFPYHWPGNLVLGTTRLNPQRAAMICN